MVGYEIGGGLYDRVRSEIPTFEWFSLTRLEKQRVFATV